MKTVEVTVKGMSALLMHQYPMQPIEAIEKKSPEEQAEIACYRDPETKMLYIPGTAVQRTLVNGAMFSKGKGRGSLARIAAATLLVTPERIDLGVKDYTIDARPVVVPATKGRVVRYRPRLDKWEGTFQIEYDENLLKEEQVRRIVDDSGKLVGFLDFRPEKKGPFGRFTVVHWTVLDGKS